MTNRRLKELDYMRVIACISVVLIHITAMGVVGYLTGSIHSKIMIFMNRSLQYATTLFVFLSGMTCYGSFEKCNEDFRLFLKRRFSTIIYPYIAVCLVYYGSYIYLGYYSFDPVFLVKGILTGTLCYHLYFIIILVQMYLLVPIFGRLFKIFSDEFVLAVVLAINIMTLEVSFPLSDRVFFKYMFFFAAGIYVLRNYGIVMKVLKRKKVKVFSALVFAATSLVYSYLYAANNANLIYGWFLHCSLSIPFLYVTGLFLGKMTKGLYSKVNLLGKSSYYIYLIHPLFLSFYVRVVDGTSVTSFSAKLLLYTATVLVTSIFSSIGYVTLKDRYGKKARLKKKMPA
ncbi:Surface polysaccharide O-acyltransferase, integral membrane enzyme [Dethiosulfatibacter aminovorans DSM 17477]|uniref:Surface polysaccharide O-acyltransferase, integral membrane enzyme n=1 Tax=Dethiosulfatibacter aminovorans DSM 17477 TaxID=1121476 RepID=A0A1M6L0H2_9FIRM|nr:acyltransferase [Dethiosulfatibacter aminovorans]SHJ64700.1 Surface polysaccharide O-acyltransferase, integral membrane enzyme [Dethiosulfatibacter aminovorans DSM 17477]